MAEATAVPAVEGLRLRRLLATAIDALILAPTALFIMLATGLVESAEAWVMPQPIIRLTGLAVGTYLLLNGYLLARHGQTVGKRLLKIRIRAATEDAVPPFWRLLIRAYAFPAVFAPISLQVLAIAYAINVLAILAPAQRCLHDYLCGTAVGPAPPR